MPDIPHDRYIGDLAEGDPLIERSPDVIRSDRRTTAPLAEQLPGLDRTRLLRDAEIRLAAWWHERPDLVGLAIGGLVALGIGTVLAVRRMRRD